MTHFTEALEFGKQRNTCLAAYQYEAYIIMIYVGIDLE